MRENGQLTCSMSAPPQGPRIISTWWRSYSGTAALWRPAAPCSRSGTRGGDQGAAKPTRVGELCKRTNGMALHLWLSWSHTGVTRGLTCHATNNLVTRRKDGVLSLPKDHHVRAFRQVELQPLLCELHQTARVHCARRGYVLAEGHAYPLHDVLQINNIMHHPQSGWCDEGPQRGPATRGKGLKALSIPCSHLLYVATQCCCGCRTGDGAPHPDETRLMAALPLRGECRQTDQLLYPLCMPKRQSLCESHPPRR